MASLLSGALLTACSVVGVRSGTEQPRYDVVARLADGVEVRRYAPRLAAETTVDGTEYAARSTGFRRVAGYIFGGNSGRARIAMTAPVAVAPAGSGERIAMTAPGSQLRDADGRWTIRFFLPAGLSEADAPTPDDARVRVVAVPAETMGVLRYTGSISADAVARARARLAAALSGSAWTPRGEPVSWFYDPPWTLPPLRRNEAAVPVAQVGAQPTAPEPSP